MKIFLLVLAIAVLAVALNALVMYLVQKRRQQRAEQHGTVLYATVLSSAKLGGLMKYADMQKITLRLQDPGASTPREVSLRSRIPAGQKITPGMRLTVVVDPKKPQRVYPASPEASRRVVVTGSRLERRHLRSTTPAQQRRQQQGRDAIPYPRNLNRR